MIDKLCWAEKWLWLAKFTVIKKKKIADLKETSSNPAGKNKNGGLAIKSHNEDQIGRSNVLCLVYHCELTLYRYVKCTVTELCKAYVHLEPIIKSSFSSE